MLRLLPLVLLLFFLGLLKMSACTPKEWSYAILERESIAVIHGEITDTRDEGRKATVKVIHYVGSGAAPRTVQLPSTETSRKTNDDPCPDFSTKFQKGKKYLIFLKETGQTPVLLYSDWTTALEAQQNNVTVNMQGKRENVDAVLRRYAKAHLQEVKVPDQNAPVWGKEKGYPFIILVTAAMMAGSGILYHIIKKLKIQHPNSSWRRR